MWGTQRTLTPAQFNLFLAVQLELHVFSGHEREAKWRGGQEETNITAKYIHPHSAVMEMLLEPSPKWKKVTFPVTQMLFSSTVKTKVLADVHMANTHVIKSPAASVVPSVYGIGNFRPLLNEGNSTVLQAVQRRCQMDYWSI